MKYVTAFLLIFLLSSYESFSQSRDSTEWEKYYAQMERYFAKGRENRKDMGYSGCGFDSSWWQRHDALVAEWENTAQIIQNDSTLSDTAKCSAGDAAFWKLFVIGRKESQPTGGNYRLRNR